MYNAFDDAVKNKLAGLEKAGTYKHYRNLSTPMDAHADMAGQRGVVVMSSNNYLGLADHPAVVKGAQDALEKFGHGTASVRFICGSMDIHEALETRLAQLHGMEAALTFSSCWAANTGLIPAITGEGDMVISDALNHASIIDGCRLVGKGVGRAVYTHGDMHALEHLLKEHRYAKHRFIITDGVFSMEGNLAHLPAICDLADRYEATLIVDDSHGVGVMGATGAGVAEFYHCADRVDIITGTLGKALGGAAGGYVAGRTHVIELLKQNARTNLFSNAISPATAGGALAALEVMQRAPQLLKTLHENVAYFRHQLKEAGFKPLDGESAIVPIIIGDTAQAMAVADALLKQGVFITGFGYPVVPEGTARLRAQVSAVHSKADLDRVVGALIAVREEMGGF
jgi:glycine C-acetyltransferase